MQENAKRAMNRCWEAPNVKPVGMGYSPNKTVKIKKHDTVLDTVVF